jgi:hypothetical protein
MQKGRALGATLMGREERDMRAIHRRILASRALLQHGLRPRAGDART